MAVMSADLRRKIIYSLVFALLVYIGLALWSDWGKLSAALAQFPWQWLPVVLGLTLLNYGGRLLRWHWYLRLLDTPIRLGDSARVFGVGMLMVMTPGKAGEFLQSYMVKNVSGAAMSKTAPVVLAERLTDGAAMLLLASTGLFAFPDRTARTVALIVFGGFLAFVLAIQIRPLALWLLGIGAKLPVVRKFAGQLYTFYESSYVIFRPRNLLLSLLVGMVCWGAEGVAYFVVLAGFGVAFSSQAVLIAIFIFSISTVIGAVFALPGGLGGVEGSLVALSTRLLGLGAASATAGALLIRFSTLWLGVSIGVICFLIWPKLLAGAEQVERNRVAAPSES